MELVAIATTLRAEQLELLEYGFRLNSPVGGHIIQKELPHGLAGFQGRWFVIFDEGPPDIARIGSIFFAKLPGALYRKLKTKAQRTGFCENLARSMVNEVPGEVNRALVHIEHLSPESVFVYGEAFAADCDFVTLNGERRHMSAVVFLADDTFGCLIAYDPIARGAGTSITQLVHSIAPLP